MKKALHKDLTCGRIVENAEPGDKIELYCSRVSVFVTVDSVEEH